MEPIKTAIDNFISHLKFERRLSKHTQLSYHTDIIQMSEYLAANYDIIHAEQIKQIHLRSWLSDLKEKGMANRSLKRKIAAQNTFFNFLITEGKIKKNPAKSLLLPKIDKPLPSFLEENQTEKLAKGTEFPESFEGFTEELIIELFYQTGMRRSELIGMKEADVNFQRKELTVLGKGNKVRIIPISEILLLRIREYLKIKEENLGFSTKNLLSLKSGKPLYPNYAYRVVKKYLSAVTTLQKKSPHILRHTFASQLLNNGADLMSIKELLGHNSLAATQVYTHLNIERLKEVYKNAHPKS